MNRRFSARRVAILASVFAISVLWGLGHLTDEDFSRLLNSH